MRSLRHPLTVIGSLLDAAALQPSRSARNHLLWLAHSQGLTARRVDEVHRAGRAGRASPGGGPAATPSACGSGWASPRRCWATRRRSCWTSRSTAWTPRASSGCAGSCASLAAEGRAVLVSSHLMSELQDTADHLVVVGRGKVIADTSVADLIAAASGDRVTLRTTAGREATTVLEHAGATVAATGRDALTISGLAAERVVALLGAARRAVLRGLRAPGDPGAGLHGTHQGRRRVPPGRRRGGRRE